MAYSFNGRIRYSETGENGQLTLPGILDYFQDCSTFHSESVGRGIETLKKKNRFWVLGAWQVIVNRYPQMGESVITSTLPYSFRNFMGLRNFTMDTADGERLAVANSFWIYLDSETGRPTALSKEETAAYPLEKKLDMEYAPRKIVLPGEFRKEEAFAVQKHHLDTNHHVNNCQYIRMAMDYLPAGFKIRQMRAEYKRQAHLHDLICPEAALEGETLTVLLNDQEGNPYAVVEFQGKEQGIAENPESKEFSSAVRMKRRNNMKKNYRAEITGVFGDPVEDNPTGAMEEAAYQACGLNYRYLTLKVTPEDFPAAMASVRALHMKGINLTMPHKIAVLPYLDELSRAASIIGAVNTIVVRDGKLFGENTDGKGFVQALINRGVSLSGKRIVILGAGGAARAISVECALARVAAVRIVNRTEERAKELAGVLTEHTPAKASWAKWTPAYQIPAGTDILINATSVGFSPNDGEKPDIDYETVAAGMVVCDVVFCPSDTLFLREAAARGAQTVNGLGMLACQGALNFTLWTEREAPLELMEETLRKELS